MKTSLFFISSLGSGGAEEMFHQLRFFQVVNQSKAIARSTAAFFYLIVLIHIFRLLSTAQFLMVNPIESKTPLEKS